MNPTTALLLLLIVASTFIFPAAAISYAHAAGATVIINQSQDCISICLCNSEIQKITFWEQK
jgi:hypothetical protein